MSDNRLYFSHINPDWIAPIDSFKIIFFPKRWWSISQWKLGIDFLRENKIMFMNKE